MKFLTFVLCVAALSCAPFSSSSSAQDTTPLPELSASQKAAIGKKIWQNECACSVDGLTTWNAGEEFPSLGIGHFIWYTRVPSPSPGRSSWPTASSAV